MEVIKGFKNILDINLSKPVITIGNFDGVHLGHQKIFNEVKKSAKNNTSIVITFHPHPVKVINPERKLKLLTPFEEKIKLIEMIGIDLLICIDFTKNIASMSAENFVKEILFKKLNISQMIIGHNYRFGKNKEGNTGLLRRLGKKYGFKVKVIRSMKIKGETVSSSRIRKLLGWGKVYEASILLGRAYSIHGTVIKGTGIGRKVLNIPTANISTPYEVVPKEGVYAVKVKIENTIYDGVANIGKNPTFGLKHPSYEVHIFDFDDNILNKEIKIYFIERLRAEKKFSNPEMLKIQIHKDIKNAKLALKESRVNIYP